MKKLFLFTVFCILSVVSLNGQNISQRIPLMKSLSKIDVTEKTISGINLKNNKTIAWDWDTIVTYDVLNNLNRRFTQTINNGLKYSILKEEWKNNEWEKIESDTFIYDANEKVISELMRYWIDSLLVNNSVFLYTYNANGNLNSQLSQRWVNNAWVNNDLFEFTYDTSGNIITDSYSVWGDSVWYKETLFSYTYDINKNLLNYTRYIWYKDSLISKILLTNTYSQGIKTSELFQFWANNNWKNKSLFTFTYDANGNKINELLQYWESNMWVNINKHTSTFDNNNNLLTSLYQNWDTNTWVNSSLDSLSYNSNGKVSNTITKIWQNNSWINSWKYTLTYDVYGNEEIMLAQHWVNNTWENYSVRTYSSDMYGNSLSGKYEEWYNNWYLFPIDLSIYTSSKEFIYSVSAPRFVAHFTSLISEINEYKDNSEINIYPNPANDFIRISYNENKVNYINIFNLQGQKVFSEKLNKKENTFTINVSNLANGIYLLQFQTDKGFISRKLIVNR